MTDNDTYGNARSDWSDSGLTIRNTARKFY